MKEIKIFQKGIKLMTVQELIDKLNEVEDKSLDIKFTSNQTLEDYKIVDVVEDIHDYRFYLEIE